MYLRLGFAHIADWQAYDHIIFVTALCSVYLVSDWQRILWLVTAFTLGHSLTLALSVFKIMVFPTNIIEFLIPITILITSILNAKNHEKQEEHYYLKYFVVLFFGFIHGCGFSNYLNTILIDSSESIWQQLLAFNIGLEIGQILIVSIVLFLSFIAVKLFHVEHSKWRLFMAGLTAGIALILISNNFQ